jgi:hypothetical protein
MRPRQRFRCRFCGVVFSAWLSAPGEPDGAMLLGHLDQRHPDRVGACLDRMRTEDITTVVVEAFEVIEEDEIR